MKDFKVVNVEEFDRIRQQGPDHFDYSLLKRIEALSNILEGDEQIILFAIQLEYGHQMIALKNMIFNGDKLAANNEMDFQKLLDIFKDYLEAWRKEFIIVEKGLSEYHDIFFLEQWKRLLIERKQKHPSESLTDLRQLLTEAQLVNREVYQKVKDDVELTEKDEREIYSAQIISTYLVQFYVAQDIVEELLKIANIRDILTDDEKLSLVEEQANRWEQTGDILFDGGEKIEEMQEN